MTLNALLILSSATIRRPNKIRANLAAAVKNNANNRRFNGTLYVHVWNVNVKPPQSEKTFIPPPIWGNVKLLSQASSTIYSTASAQCSNIDVRFLLKDVTPHDNGQKLETNRLIDFVFVDTSLKSVGNQIQDFVQNQILRKSDKVEVQFLTTPENEKDEHNSDSEDAVSVSSTANEDPNPNYKKFSVVALGGTFDRLHNGHKILLTESVLRCEKELIVGVTNEDMIKSKLLYELIEPIDLRLKYVSEFLQDVSPPLNFRIVPISDPFGPTIVDENIDLIVVSQETIRGGQKINEIREKKNYHPLVIHAIDLCSEPNKETEHEEDKISSSSKRLRVLGERLCPSKLEPSLPYIIGLTGGIASGKSTICSYLETLNIPSVNCDALAHEAYLPGTSCFDQIVQVFGSDILTTTTTVPHSSNSGSVCSEEQVMATINRRALGAKVFGNPEELKKLTDIVWPEIKRLALAKIQELSCQGKKMIVVDAAVLLEANWNDMCHEVWVAFVPKQESIKRIEGRDKLSKEDAEKRIDSQLSNQNRLSQATFAFCSLWEKEFTRQQVDKALKEIQSVISSLDKAKL